MYTEGFEVKTNEELPLNDTKRNILFLSSIDGRQLKEPVKIIYFDGPPEDISKKSEHDFCYIINQSIETAKKQGQILPESIIKSVRNIRESCMFDCDKEHVAMFYISKLDDGTYTSYSGKIHIVDDRYDCSFYEVCDEMLPVLNNFVEEE